jgi:hypothetical protein
MSNLPDELRARARYGQLIAVVGQPRTADERELLARWLSDNDADLLVGPSSAPPPNEPPAATGYSLQRSARWSSVPHQALAATVPSSSRTGSSSGSSPLQQATDTAYSSRAEDVLDLAVRSRHRDGAPQNLFVGAWGSRGATWRGSGARDLVGGTTTGGGCRRSGFGPHAERHGRTEAQSSPLGRIATAGFAGPGRSAAVGVRRPDRCKGR